MRNFAYIFGFAITAAALTTGIGPALAEGGVTHEPGLSLEQPQPPSPLPPPPRPLAPPSLNKQKGDPGMLGLPWPKSPDEAAKTLSSLYAALATSGDHRHAGEIGAAIEKLWRLDGGDTVNLLIERGKAFTARTEFDKALTMLDAAVDLAPDYAEAFNTRAYTHYRMGHTDLALGDLRRAIALEPNHFRALDGMAKILNDIGEKKAALKTYELLLKVHPEIEGAKDAAEELKKAVEGQGI